MLALFRLALQAVRPLRVRALRRSWEQKKAKYVGKSVRWSYAPAEVWELIATRDTPGWKIIEAEQFALINDALLYMSGAETLEDLQYKRGFKDGVVKSVQLLSKMIDSSTEEEQLIKRAQSHLKIAVGED